MDRPIQVLDRFDPMPVEIMFCGFQMMLGSPHRLKRFVDVGMRRRRGCRNRGNRCRCGNWCRRSFGSGSSRREDQRQQNCYQDEQSQQPYFLQVFLLVRLPARTQPL